MILVVDNHGFTTNILCHQLGAVVRVTAAELAALNLADYTHVVVTHGTAAAQLGPLTQQPQLPVLAIGAGYQQLAQAYGHPGSARRHPVYGQAVTHRHSQAGLFADMPNPVDLTSYHAWRLTDLDAARFTVQAVDAQDAALAFQVVGTHHWGVHADPAALQSDSGARLIDNFLALAAVAPAAATIQTATGPAPRPMACFTREVPGSLDLVATFAALQQDSSAAFWLDSAAPQQDGDNVSIMGTNTGPLAQTVRWDVATQRVQIAQDGAQRVVHQDIFAYLQSHAWQPTQPLALPGFTGGWVGYLGYEAKQATLRNHRNRWQASTPDAYWIKPQHFIRYDHTTEVTTLVAYADAALLDAAHSALIFNTATSAPSSPTPHNEAPARLEPTGSWRLEAGDYEQRVAQLRGLLHTGHAAGICLTDTYHQQDYHGDGLDLYVRLRTHNPAPYAGYLRFSTFGDSLEVLSASPEKFLSVDSTGRVESKPIKGTVARSADPSLDARIATQMAADPKIQSENLMITDLLRDDLAQVTVPGSIEVPKLMAVETFATVHQLVTTVTGQLRQDATALEALRSVFPGGSMTGAPKLVSVETLDDVEVGPRGIYSGTMGWLGDDQTAELNVIIRTIVLDGHNLTIGAGGAVVVDSDPVAEEREKQLKARALLESLTEDPS